MVKIMIPAVCTRRPHRRPARRRARHAMVSGRSVHVALVRPDKPEVHNLRSIRPLFNNWRIVKQVSRHAGLEPFHPIGASVCLTKRPPATVDARCALDHALPACCALPAWSARRPARSLNRFGGGGWRSDRRVVGGRGQGYRRESKAAPDPTCLFLPRGEGPMGPRFFFRGGRFFAPEACPMAAQR